MHDKKTTHSDTHTRSQVSKTYSSQMSSQLKVAPEI